MRNFTSFYYKTSSGHSPVEEFINGLSPDVQRKLFKKIEWLEEYGQRLTKPHAEKISKYIYELKVHREDVVIRVLYFFFSGNKIIFVDGFKKKTNKTPPKEIKLSEERRNDFLMKEDKI